MIDHINKISTIRKCSFLSAATDIFSAKISGTFKRFGKNISFYIFLPESFVISYKVFEKFYFFVLIDHRSQLTHGRKVLMTLEMISKLVHRVNAFYKL